MNGSEFWALMVLIAMFVVLFVGVVFLQVAR